MSSTWVVVLIKTSFTKQRLQPALDQVGKALARRTRYSRAVVGTGDRVLVVPPGMMSRLAATWDRRMLERARMDRNVAAARGISRRRRRRDAVLLSSDCSGHHRTVANSSIPRPAARSCGGGCRATGEASPIRSTCVQGASRPFGYSLAKFRHEAKIAALLRVITPGPRAGRSRSRIFAVAACCLTHLELIGWRTC